MYLVNFLNLQTSAQVFEKFRIGRTLVGLKDGSNQIFHVPSSERFVHTPPVITIEVYLNGMRLTETDDYVPIESGGLGTGFDAIQLVVRPRANDHILADYVVV